MYLTETEFGILLAMLIGAMVFALGRRRPVQVAVSAPVVVAKPVAVAHQARQWIHVPFPLELTPNLSLYVVEPNNLPEFHRVHREKPLPYMRLAKLWGSRRYLKDAFLVMQKGRELQREHPNCFILCGNREKEPQRKG